MNILKFIFLIKDVLPQFLEQKNIHEYEFPKIPSKWNNQNLSNKWSRLYDIKQEVNIAIEEKRANKEIGSSLEAELKITSNKEIFDLLDGMDLPEYFITSKADKFKNDIDDKLTIEVKKTSGTKCPRCWKILKTKCARCGEATVN